MKSVTLTRAYQDRNATLGVIQLEGMRPIFTLENPWINNEPSTSCIPKGQYVCEPFSGNKYKAVYEVRNVVDRSYILFHAGNTAKDTKGCILLGETSSYHNSMPFIGGSKKAVEVFKETIGVSRFWLEIK